VRQSGILFETGIVLPVIRPLIIAIVLLAQTGCAVVAVADAVVSVVSTTVEVTADVIGAAVDVVIPD
jgi:hypothetical protein